MNSLLAGAISTFLPMLAEKGIKEGRQFIDNMLMKMSSSNTKEREEAQEEFNRSLLGSIIEINTKVEETNQKQTQAMEEISQLKSIIEQLSERHLIAVKEMNNLKKMMRVSITLLGIIIILGIISYIM